MLLGQGRVKAARPSLRSSRQNKRIIFGKTQMIQCQRLGMLMLKLSE